MPNFVNKIELKPSVDIFEKMSLSYDEKVQKRGNIDNAVVHNSDGSVNEGLTDKFLLHHKQENDNQRSFFQTGQSWKNNNSNNSFKVWAFKNWILLKK